EPEEAAREQVVALGILAIDPPREVEQQLVKTARQEHAVALPFYAGHLVDAPDAPRVHRRIDVAHRELVRRNLAVRMHEPLAKEQLQLLFWKIRIDARERQHVEREIPRRV